MGKVDLPYLNSFKSSSGSWRYYYRRAGQRIKLEPTSLLEDYAKAHALFEAAPAATQVLRNSFGELLDAYYRSTSYTQRQPKTQKEYSYYLDKFRATLGHILLKPLNGLTYRALTEYRDKYLSDHPVAANKAMGVLKTVLAFGVKRDFLRENPLANMETLKTDSDGWAPWPADALDKFSKESRGAARIAFFLARYTGQRRGDVLTMKFESIQDGGIHVRQQKTGTQVWVPIHPILNREIESFKKIYADRAASRGRRGNPVPLGQFVVQRENGQPYTSDGFGTIWVREQNRLNCKWPFHGLRKNAVEALNEVGCTPQEVQAITGHLTLAMVQLYGKNTNQRKLATKAMKLWSDTPTKSE